MNRVLLDAVSAVAMHFYSDALERYPCLLLDVSQEPNEEAMVVWRVLLAIDELGVEIHAAVAFDNAQRVGVISGEQEELPF